jgi:hypothetical protein
MGGVFALTECAAENIRGENDAYNAGIAGCAAGLVAGVRGMITVLIQHMIIELVVTDMSHLCSSLNRYHVRSVRWCWRNNVCIRILWWQLEGSVSQHV